MGVRRKWLILAGVGFGCLLAALAGFWFHVNSHTAARLARKYDVPPVELGDLETADLELGKRIVHVRNGCVDCHGQRLTGHTVIDDPALGFIQGPNLTPARLGNWSPGEIARAIRHGVGKQGQPLVLMPSHEYFRLSQGDLTAVVAYLRSLPAEGEVETRVQLRPFGRFLLWAGKLPTMLPAENLDHSRGFDSKPEEGPTAEFGKYLVESACVGCHGADLKGGPIPGGAPDWPPASDLTRARNGKWSREEFRRAMRYGESADGAKLRPPMPVALAAQMSDVELEAIWNFLSQPASPEDIAVKD